MVQTAVVITVDEIVYRTLGWGWAASLDKVGSAAVRTGAALGAAVAIGVCGALTRWACSGQGAAVTKDTLGASRSA